MIVVTIHIVLVQHIQIFTTSKNALDGLRTIGVPVVVASLPWRVATWAICAVEVGTWNCVGLVAHFIYRTCCSRSIADFLELQPGSGQRTLSNNSQPRILTEQPMRFNMPEKTICTDIIIQSRVVLSVFCSLFRRETCFNKRRLCGFLGFYARVNIINRDGKETGPQSHYLHQLALIVALYAIRISMICLLCQSNVNLHERVLCGCGH